MKIAFDVKGTLQGPKGELVLGLLLELQKMGHECVVWSNSYGFAVDCVADLGLKNVRAESKSGKYDLDKANWYDLAIEDDTSQTWLAAKRLIFVKDIPGGMGGVLKLAHVINEGGQEPTEGVDDEGQETF